MVKQSVRPLSQFEVRVTVVRPLIAFIGGLTPSAPHRCEGVLSCYANPSVPFSPSGQRTGYRLQPLLRSL